MEFTINIKHQTTFVKRASLVLLFFLYLATSVFSQDVGISHYQRKLVVSSLIIPGEEYKSEYFFIFFPDSIYDNGVIKVKKIIIENKGIKVKGQFVFSNNQYTGSTYYVKKKDITSFEKSLLSKMGTMDLSKESLDTLGIKLEKSKFNNRHYKYQITGF